METQNNENKIWSNAWVVCALALLCTLLWGSAFPCVKIGYQLFHIGGQDTGSQILFAGYRFTLAGVLTWIIASVSSKKPVLVNREIMKQTALLGIVQTGIQYIFFYVGMSNTTGVKGAIITASSSFFSILFAHFFIKSEKITVKKFLGCIFGFLGVAVVNFSAQGMAGGFALNGEGFLVLASMAYAIGSVYIKFFAHKDNSFTITAFQLLTGGIMLIILGLCMGGKVSGFTMKSSLLLLYMGLLSSVAFSLWTLLLKYNPVGRVAIYGFANPVFGVVLSAIFLGENAFTLKNFLALICVSIGVIIVNVQISCKKRANRIQ